MFIIQLLEVMAIVLLFIINISMAIKLKVKSHEIRVLSQDLIDLRVKVNKEEVKLTEDMLKCNTLVVNTLLKIKKNYQVNKTNKLVLLEFLILFMRNVDTQMIYKVDISKKFTYKDACNCILKYINSPEFTEKQIQEVLNSIYFLITK